MRLIVMTPRQRAVLRCLGLGMTNVEAGKAIGFSGSVVQIECDRLAAKFGAEDRPSLVRKARQAGALPATVSDFAPALRSMMERRAF